MELSEEHEHRASRFLNRERSKAQEWNVYRFNFYLLRYILWEFFIMWKNIFFVIKIKTQPSALFNANVFYAYIYIIPIKSFIFYSRQVLENIILQIFFNI